MQTEHVSVYFPLITKIPKPLGRLANLSSKAVCLFRLHDSLNLNICFTQIFSHKFGVLHVY